MPATRLERAVDAVLRRCLALREGEDLVIVADPDSGELARALLGGARAAGADAVAIELPPLGRRGTEPPPTVAAALAASDVFIAPCLPSLSHTRALEAALETGARGATMPGATVDTVARLMTADLDVMARRTRAVAELLTEADDARMTCPHGTELELDLRGREGIGDDGDLAAAGAFGNLPCGEGFISPAGGSGRLVVHSIAMVGRTPPRRLEVEDGRLVDADDPRFLELLDAHGPDGRHLAELGVGTNENATLTGSMLEDEKLLGTCHVAFGASASIGGTVAVPVHLDTLVLDPTLVVGGTTVVDAGRFVL